MKKTLTAIAVILVLAGIQFVTYQLMASDKLSKQAIKNLDINDQLPSDTIIFSSIVTIYGNQKQSIKPYDLHLSNKVYSTIIKKKLSPSIVFNEIEFGTYCNKVVQEAKNNMSSENFNSFLINNNPYNNKTRLSITALEEQKFFVTVNYNWSGNKDFFYKENKYVWILFSWLKI